MPRLSEILGEDMPGIAKRHGLEEIRLKRNTCPYVKINGRGTLIDNIITDNAFENILNRICRNSYHSHADTVKRGYINAGEGIRVGVSGRAITDRDSIVNIVNIENMTIRIPRLIRGVCHPLYKMISQSESSISILIYSPPGVGKTTLLRDLALRLADAPSYKRIVLLDAREELYIPGMDTTPLLSVYRGYPKDLAIEAAVRTMTPDFIISDEIGSPGEAEQIRQYQNSGVSFIATAHGSELDGLLRRPSMAILHEEECFDLYCGITREPGTDSYKFKILTREEAKKCLKQ